MKKIVIIGSPGAGKTTLACVLGNLLKIEVIHLDRHFWRVGWKEYSRKKRMRIQRRLIHRNDCWIIEGTYMGSSHYRIKEADTIIFLDVPRFLCLRRAIKRYRQYRGCTRADLPDGCTERLRLLYLLKILAFPNRGRKELRAEIKKLQDKHEKKTILVWSDGELKGFLSLPSAQQRAYLSEAENGSSRPELQNSSASSSLVATQLAFLGNR